MIIMKRLFVTAISVMALLSVTAQEAKEAELTSADYIVRTSNVKKNMAKAEKPSAGGEEEKEEEQAKDWIGQHFRYYSLCDWQEGMKFMVLPEKYDLVVNTFCDAKTGKEVSSMRLRRKIMIYKGYHQASTGRFRMDFHCQDDNHDYYYEIPSGTFDDYCYGKLGVPTLAYLGDVDIARRELIGKVVYTKTKHFRRDVDWDSDSFEEVEVPENSEVTVTAVGVGTRSYPVKIIVKDKSGNEFYQTVAISKTNCGMRDDEFINGDKYKFLFANSFELKDAMMIVSANYKDYIGKTVHTKFATKMLNEKMTRTVNVVALSEYTIETVRPHANDRFVTLKLKDNYTSRILYKDVTFKLDDTVDGVADGKSDYFGYLFAMGKGKEHETSAATRAAIREGRVTFGMSEDEVVMTLGEPENIINDKSGIYRWFYKRTKGKILVVHFAKDGTVEKTTVLQPGQKMR